MDDPQARRDASAKGMGCLLFWGSIGVILLASGVSLMNRWSTLGGPAKGGAVVLVVLGTLALLPPLGVLVISLVVRMFMRKLKRDFAGAAGQMLKNTRAMYDQEHTFRPASEEDFEDLDRDYYESTTATLSEAGFRHLGDIVDETIEQLHGIGTPIRVIASLDGSTQVAIYHLDVPDPSGNIRLMCDVNTEFSDGTFLLTSNTLGADQMTPPPQIHRRQHPLETPPQELIRLHEIEKQKLLAAKEGVRCVTVSTLADAIASEQRQQAVKNAFRKGIGYLDPDEVRRISAGAALDPDSADEVAKAVDEMRQREP